MLQKIIERILPKKEWVFLPVFFSIYILYYWFNQQDFELFSFPKETISIATMLKYDISARISTLYKGLFILLSTFVIFSYTISTIYEKKWLPKSSFYCFNYIAILLIILLYTHVLYGDNMLLIKLLFCYNLFVIVQEIFFRHLYLGSKNNTKKTLYVWSAILSISLIFPIREYLSYTASSFNFTFLTISFLTLNFLIINTGALLHITSNEKLNQLIRITKYFTLLPLISVVSYEFHIILVNKGFSFFSTLNSYIVLIISLFIIVIISAFINFKFKKNRINEVKTLTQFYIPVFIFGLISFVHYSPFIDQPEEIFELANPANSIMRLMDFGEIPMVDFLSSHLLSEQLFSYLFSLLNGYDGSLGFLSYNFLYYPFIAIILYFFFQFILRDYITAFVLSILFPYIDILIQHTYAPTLVSIILFIKLIEHYSLKGLIKCVLWIVFVTFWKAEIALANIYLSAAFFSLFILFNFKSRMIIDFLKVGLTAIFICLTLVFIVHFNTESDVLINMKKALSYFTANQAHGLTSIAYNLGRYFKYHYFIFPTLIVFSLFGVLSIISKAKNSKILFRLLIAFLFLFIIYFVTAQRGLVRHNMFSHSGRFSGPLFLMLGLLIIAFRMRAGKKNRSAIFLLSSTLLISNFAFPEKQELNSPFETWIKKISKFDKVWASGEKPIARITDNKNFIAANFGDIKGFLDENISDSATFYDFSNTPMTYFYTKRKIPSYFNQMPICVINKELQDLHIIELPKYEIPIVFFSNNPRTFWDKVDGVPNELRHSYIADYLYSNYIPYVIINNQTTWLKTDVAHSIKRKNETILWTENPDSKYITIPTQDMKKGMYNVIRIKTKNNPNKCSEFKINNTLLKSHRITADGFQEILLNENKIPESINIEYTDTLSKVQVVRMKYCPDTVSFKKRTFKLHKLASIMGSYSKTPVLKKQTLNSSSTNFNKVEYILDRNLQKNHSFVEILVKPTLINQKVTLAYKVKNEELGQFIFDVEASAENKIYQIPIHSQFAWHKFTVEKLIFTSSNEFGKIIKEVSILNK